MRRRLDDGRRRRLNNQKWLLNENGRLGLVAVRGAGVVGQVSVAVSVGRDGPGSTETVTASGEARPGSASVLGAGIVCYSQGKER
jgi:hypothetical protein